MSAQEETAKALTLAAIEKMKLFKHEVSTEEHNKFVADEIAKVYRTIYNAVISARD